MVTIYFLAESSWFRTCRFALEIRPEKLIVSCKFMCGTTGFPVCFILIYYSCLSYYVNSPKILYGKYYKPLITAWNFQFAFFFKSCVWVWFTNFCFSNTIVNVYLFVIRFFYFEEIKLQLLSEPNYVFVCNSELLRVKDVKTTVFCFSDLSLTKRLYINMLLDIRIRKVDVDIQRSLKKICSH